MTAVLSRCGIDAAVTDTLVNLSRFVRAIALAEGSSSSPSAARGKGQGTAAVTYDPNAFTEELHWIQHRLVAVPGPLRITTRPTDAKSSSTSSPMSPSIPPLVTSFSPSGSPSSSTDSTEDINTNTSSTYGYGSTPELGDDYYHHALHTATATLLRNVTPTPTNTPLEPALRIAAILYLKELIPDFPRNVGGYAILLALLAHHTRAATARYAAARRRDADVVDDSRLGSSRGRKQSQDGLSTEEQGRGDGERGSTEDWRAMRPALLWISVVGSLASVLADANECRYGASQYDRSVYAACVATVVGGPVVAVESPRTVVDEVTITDEDLVLCRLISLRDVRGDRWDDREALKRILIGREYA